MLKKIVFLELLLILICPNIVHSGIITSIYDFELVDQKAIQALENEKKTVLDRIAKRQQFIQENENNSDLLDFINFLVMQKILEPQTSLNNDQRLVKNAWCNDPVLVDIVKNFLKTGNILIPKEYAQEHHLEEVLSFITHGPLQMEVDTTVIVDQERLFKNIQDFQKTLVLSCETWFLQQLNKYSYYFGELRKGPHILIGAPKKEKLFTIMMIFFDIWAADPDKEENKNNFIKAANIYCLRYPEYFETIKMYVENKIYDAIKVKFKTQNPKIIGAEFLKIRNRITKKPWQFWL